MTDDWRPLPIPMPANDGRAEATISFEQITQREAEISERSQEIGLRFNEGRAKAERDALEMMERAKAMSAPVQKLTPKMLECLRQLKRVEDANDVAPTAAEISRLAGKPSYWSYNCLYQLTNEGLVGRNRIGKWMLTEAGRAALAHRTIIA